MHQQTGRVRARDEIGRRHRECRRRRPARSDASPDRCRRRSRRCPSAQRRRPSAAHRSRAESRRTAVFFRSCAQVARLERLDEDRRVPAVPAMLRERREQLLLERQPDAAEVGRVLGFGIDADRPVRARARAVCASSITSSNVGTCELAVVLVRPEREPLLRAQRLDLGEREVLGEPAGDRLAVDGLRRACAIGKLRRRRRSCRRSRSRAARSARRPSSRRDPAR